MNRERSLRTAVPYVLPGALLVLIFIYLPVVLSFAFSLYRWSSFSVSKVYVGFRYYERLLSDPIFYTALQNNALYAVISIVCQVGVGLILAAILEEKVFRKYQPFLRTVYFVPSVISFTVIGLLWQMLYNPDIGILNAALRGIGLGRFALGWLGDSRLAIYAVIAVSQWQYTGYIMMLFLVAIQKIPPELYEAAMIDGANRAQSFRHVTVPQVKAMIVVNMAITVIGAFKVFDEVYIMTGGGPGRSTEVLATYLYRSAFRNDEMGFANAIGCVIFLMTFALSVLQLRLSRIGRIE
jgi:raffinose/stachyose/melibiose transport system permease protein